jgi:hypothetical protein
MCVVCVVFESVCVCVCVCVCVPEQMHVHTRNNICWILSKGPI